MQAEVRVLIEQDLDILAARQQGKQLAGQAGLRGSELTLVATAISELARNIVVYARRGEITLSVRREGTRSGLLIIAQDNGPGIADLELAMRDGYSTSGSLGLGLPGARRLVDEFEIRSELGQGTTVRMTKWAGV